MTTPFLAKPGLKSEEPRGAAARSQETQAAGMQEQFSGNVPARDERSMAEILTERLAKADPASPSPVFIP